MQNIIILLCSLFITTNITAQTFLDKSPKERLLEALEYYGIHHKEIVYAQAIIETGNFKSKGCTRDNNLFGLRGRNGYYKYNHWSESVKAYKEKIQSRYKSGEDYYAFLKRIRYAENPDYIKVLKQIVNKYSNQFN